MISAGKCHIGVPDASLLSQALPLKPSGAVLIRGFGMSSFGFCPSLTVLRGTEPPKVHVCRWSTACAFVVLNNRSNACGPVVQLDACVDSAAYYIRRPPPTYN